MVGSRNAAEARKGTAAVALAGRAAGGVLCLVLLFGLGLAACAGPQPSPPQTAAPGLGSGSSRAVEIGQLNGLRPAELVALLGQPDLRRTEPPAELWQYRGADCVLDVYLYRDGNVDHVIRAEARDRGAFGGACRDGDPSLRRLRQSRL